MELWLLFGIMCYFFYAISTCIDKYMMNLNYGVISTNIFKMFFDGVVVLTIGLIFFHLNLAGNFSFLLLLPGAIQAFSMLIYYSALKLKDVGEIMPFYQSSGILFIFLSAVVVFNEFVTIYNYFGIMLILIGVYLVLSRDGLKIPKMDKGSLLILILIPADVISALLIKKLLFNIEPINLVIIMYFSATFFLVCFQILYRKRISDIFTGFKSKIPKIVSASFFGSIGTLFLYSALSLGYASKVYPLQGLNSIFIFIIALVFLKEKFYWHRLIGIVIAFFGIYLIT